ncbi:sensor histidine kinase [Actinomadura oligospora]|uniref:sensor histidine kinase n=1 Tax=Actinomadura oligospora TaxID=111804 RepID=UPI0004B31C6E|nr:histidine kinase [Actinomadura oligospora]
MSRTVLADRRAALWNALWRVTPDPPSRTSRWAVMADAVLAVLLAVGALGVVMDVSDDGPHPFPPGDQYPPDPSDPPDVPDEPDAPDVPGAPLAPPPPPEPHYGPGVHVPGMRGLDPAHTTLHGLSVWWHIALALLIALPIAVRRRYPLGALWTVSVAAVLFHKGVYLNPTFTFAALVIAAYSAVVYSPHQRLAIGTAVVDVLAVVLFRHSLVPQMNPSLLGFLLLIPVGLGANAIHTWQQRVRALEARQEEATRRAVERERSRIAQELHDVVTHNVSVMVVQAGAARMVLRDEPDRAEAAMRAVESGGRAAMTELRHVMNLLTMDGEPEEADLAPRPGLAQVPALAERVRATGVKVDLIVSGEPSDLPEGMDLAAYRVVQEALTNTLKHAAGARVGIVVAHTPGELTVEVTDTGGGATSHSGNGRGLLGLRERVAVFGGVLEHGPTPSGGYRVHATFPAAR